MNRYDRIPIWETKQRLDRLSEFHDNVVDYFENSEYSWKAEGQIETDDAVEARVAINFGLQTARRIIAASGVATSVTSGDGADISGNPHRMDILPNLFHLHKTDVEYTTAIDLIQCAMGVYDDDTTAAWIRTLNPLWWFGRLVIWIVRLPFLLLGAAGFDAQKAEESIWGKLSKFVLGAATTIGLVIEIVDKLGQLDSLRSLFK